MGMVVVGIMIRRRGRGVHVDGEAGDDDGLN